MSQRPAGIRYLMSFFSFTSSLNSCLCLTYIALLLFFCSPKHSLLPDFPKRYLYKAPSEVANLFLLLSKVYSHFSLCFVQTTVVLGFLYHLHMFNPSSPNTRLSSSNLSHCLLICGAGMLILHYHLLCFKSIGMFF